MATPIPAGRERPQKILVAMWELSGGTTKSLKYEDIVVCAFRKFPADFALRGHPEFPDSSDIHKPLYGTLKRAGYVRAADKEFALTASGVDAARGLAAAAGDTKAAAAAAVAAANGDRLVRSDHREIEHMLKSPAYELFVNGQAEKILDTDFHQFIKCTARTPHNDFLGRMRTAEGAIKAARKLKQPSAEVAGNLSQLWPLMVKKFKQEIDWRRGKRP